MGKTHQEAEKPGPKIFDVNSKLGTGYSNGLYMKWLRPNKFYVCFRCPHILKYPKSLKA
jgi:hypothetical protein